MKSAAEWKKLLVEVEKTTKAEFKDVEYIAERILTISGNEGHELTEGEAWVLARKICKSVN